MIVLLLNIYWHLLIMSLVAGGLYLVLKVLRVLTLKCFTATWHYYANLIAISFFVVPYFVLAPFFHLGVGKLAPLSQLADAAPVSNNTMGLQAASYTAIFFDVAPYILIPGTLIFFVVTFIERYRLKKRVFTACRLTSEKRFLRILGKCKNKMGIAKEVPIYLTPYVSTPFIYGSLNPCIVLSDVKFSSRELEFIFLHELTHWKRRDLWVKGFMLFINALHWFNPLAYVARKDIDRFCEPSCDESVTRSFSYQEKKRDCELLLGVTPEHYRAKQRISLSVCIQQQPEIPRKENQHDT